MEEYVYTLGDVIVLHDNCEFVVVPGQFREHVLVWAQHLRNMQELVYQTSFLPADEREGGYW